MLIFLSQNYRFFSDCKYKVTGFSSQYLHFDHPYNSTDYLISSLVNRDETVLSDVYPDFVAVFKENYPDFVTKN